MYNDFIIYFFVILGIAATVGYVLKIKINSKKDLSKNRNISIQIGNKIGEDQAGRDIKK